MTEQNPYTLEQIQDVIEIIKHSQLLGMRVTAAAQKTLTMELPYSNAIVGNPKTGVIHGGALSTLLDTACGMIAALSLDNPGACPTLDLRIDYMTAAKPNSPLFADAQIYRITDNVIFTRGQAYQSDINKPVAYCVATYVRPAAEAHTEKLS